MWWLEELWYWFWYYRRGKIKFKVWKLGDTYEVAASNGWETVVNCFGSTPEQAKEMAIYKLNRAMNRDENEQELVYEGEGFAVYREKEKPIEFD